MQMPALLRLSAALHYCCSEPKQRDSINNNRAHFTITFTVDRRIAITIAECVYNVCCCSLSYTLFVPLIFGDGWRFTRWVVRLLVALLMIRCVLDCVLQGLCIASERRVGFVLLIICLFAHGHPPPPQYKRYVLMCSAFCRTVNSFIHT